MLLENKNAWAFDWEVYPNLATLVAREVGTKNYVKFIIHESQNDSEALIEWLATRPILIGFNSLDFDAQITEHVYRHGTYFTAEFVYEFIQKLPINDSNIDRFDLPFSEWDLTHFHIDLFKLNHYDNAARMTSLKWLEYSTRWKKLRDLPFAPHENVTASNMVRVLRYNANDVDITHDFTYRCANMIELRSVLAKKYRQNRIINMSDSSIGSYIFEHILTKDCGLNKNMLKAGTKHKEIHGKDILLPYINFDSAEFQQVHDTFKNRVYKSPKGGQLKDVAGKEYTQNVLFDDMVFVFGSGGIHACYKAGEYLSDEDHVILSIDVASYYPNLAIANKIYPQHIGKMFCNIYESVYNERKKYPKGDALNYAYKIALNSVYGKSNSEYSIFYDLSYLLKITVNGQLLLAMLAEQLAKFGRLLMVNTDGLEIKIPRAKLKEVRELCAHWELLTGLELEENLYDKLIIRDVNNYIAVDVKGKAKRKGVFEIYDDITEAGGKPHSYHKTPNATIIPQALFDYYVNDTPIRDTIEGCNDIFEFCFGIKKRKGFEYWLISADGGVIDIEKRDDRVLRYFISPNGANIYKFWKDERKNNIQAVNKGQLVSLAMNIGNSKIEVVRKKASEEKSEIIIKYDVDREYYIKKAQEIVDIINAETRDHAYDNYIKELEKQSDQQ